MAGKLRIELSARRMEEVQLVLKENLVERKWLKSDSGEDGQRKGGEMFVGELEMPEEVGGMENFSSSERV